MNSENRNKNFLLMRFHVRIVMILLDIASLESYAFEVVRDLS